jgi:hypothetical protein
MSGVLLDRDTGRPEAPAVLLGPSGLPAHVERNLEAGWSQPRYTGVEPDFSRLPQSVIDNLEKARRADFSKASPFLNVVAGLGAARSASSSPTRR